MTTETIASGPQGQLITNPTITNPAAECLLIPAEYDAEKVTAEDVLHDGMIWTVGPDPRGNAEAARDAFAVVCDYLDLDVFEQETAILSIDSGSLPIEAREIKAGDPGPPSAAYWLWLIEQVLGCGK